MRLYVIYDEQGNIIAATEGGIDPNSITAKPLAGPNQIAAEFDVPAPYESLRLLELSRQLQVDTLSGRLVVKQ